MPRISSVTRTVVLAPAGHSVKVYGINIIKNAMGGVTFALTSGTSGQWPKSGVTSPLFVGLFRADRGFSGATNVMQMSLFGAEGKNGLWAYMKPSVAGTTVNVIWE